jgi:hypothetical protein
MPCSWTRARAKSTEASWQKLAHAKAETELPATGHFCTRDDQERPHLKDADHEVRPVKPASIVEYKEIKLK